MNTQNNQNLPRDMQTDNNNRIAELLLNAKLCYRKRDLEKALSLYQEVLQHDPDNKVALQGVAECQ